MLPLLLFSALLTLSSCLSREYYLVNQNKNWTDAQTYCRQNYTDLATIENDNDQSSVMAAINNSSYNGTGQIWIGLYEDVQNSWRWRLDNDTFYGVGEKNYRNWDSNTPDNNGGKEMCTQMMNNGFWNDVNCNLLAKFICYNGANNSNIMVNISVNASDARQYCIQHYTDLASIRNTTENQQIFNQAGGEVVWIGLYRTRLWSDQSNSTYENWLTGEPNNMGGMEHCSSVWRFYSGVWNDSPCTYAYPFVCYRATTTTATTTVTPTTTTQLTTSTVTPTTATTSAAYPSSEPCYNYSILNDTWRATDHHYTVWGLHCDRDINWNGWYRLLYQGNNARMPESCVTEGMCGTHASLWLNGSHPRLEDGVVSRPVCGSWGGGCCNYPSSPVRVKACPGDYYVYEFVKTNNCYYAYCADTSATNSTSVAPTTTTSSVVPTTTTSSVTPTTQLTTSAVTPTTTTTSAAFSYPSSDPCYNYSILNDTWRATDHHYTVWGLHCDRDINWNGWYRLLYQGNNTRMPESCVTEGMCGTHASLWLNGSHPRLEDGVVSRPVCGHWWGSCCGIPSYSIRVKACPGDYYVYEFVSPSGCALAYCADTSATNSTSATPTNTITSVEPTTATNSVMTSTAFVPGAVIGTRFKITSTRNLTQSEIENFIQNNLQQALIQRNVSSTIRVRVKRVIKIP